MCEVIPLPAGTAFADLLAAYRDPEQLLGRQPLFRQLWSRAGTGEDRLSSSAA
ncbi:MAG TPA: hypothetical protein VI248_11315 [Kineosporiaceae bacterium]